MLRAWAFPRRLVTYLGLVGLAGLAAYLAWDLYFPKPPSLWDQACSRDSATREAAARKLLAADPRRMLGVLIDTAYARDSDFREFSELPLELVEDLAAMLDDDDPLRVAAAAEAIRVLAHHHEEYPFSEAIPGLVRALRNRETGKEIPVAVEDIVRQQRVESAAIDAIGALGNRAREAVPALLAALDRGVAEAATALTAMDLSKSEILELVGRLSSPDKYCRMTTSEALAYFPEHQDIFLGPLTSLLADADGKVVEYALDSLSALQPTERSVALRAIDLIPRDDVRAAALQVLVRNRSGAPERIEALARALRDPELAGAALGAFEFTNAPVPQEILPALLDVCRGEDRDLRWRALSLIRAAGKAARRHVAVLREIFAREADEDLRRDAGEILAEIESAR